MYTDHTAIEKIMSFVYSEIVVVIIAIKIYSSAKFIMWLVFEFYSFFICYNFSTQKSSK